MKAMARKVVTIVGGTLLTVWAHGLPAQNSGDDQHQHHQHHHQQPARSAGESALSGTLDGGVRVIRMEAFQYGFKPDPVVVSRGEKVRLVITSTDVVHGIMIRELGINEKLPPGKEVMVEFQADESGTFIIHCSIFCGPGHGKMHGQLIVQ